MLLTFALLSLIWLPTLLGGEVRRLALDGDVGMLLRKLLSLYEYLWELPLLTLPPLMPPAPVGAM